MHLKLQNVGKAFAGQTVLDALSLTLVRGHIGCLLGPSGCGKTTALRTIAGFERINAGHIVLDDQAISSAEHHTPPQHRRMGMVFQDYALLPHLNARDNVAFGLHHLRKHERRERAAEYLSLVGLPGYGGRFPHELSGGQQQRVALARALAPQPRLVLLDEPFSSLDVELRTHLAREVRDILQRCGATALMVTHDQLEAFAMADEIGVLNAGRIEQWDSAYNLYHRPATRFVADFIGQGVLLPGEINRNGEVEIEIGVLPGKLVGTAPSHGQVDVLMRPDDVLHDDRSSLRAVVTHKAFRGADILYTLELPSGAKLLALAPSHHNHALGEPLGIRLATDHIVAFPRQ